MKQHEIAELFNEMGDLLELKGENPFRIRAYRRAALQLEQFTGDLQSLADEGRLKELPGIGEDLSNKIAEYLSHGRIKALDWLRQKTPPGVLEMLRIPGVGPKTAQLLSKKLKIESVSQLKSAAENHKLRSLPGFQAKKEQAILKGIEILQKGQARMHLGIAYPLAQTILAFLGKLPGVTRTSTAGSLRRMRETIGDLDVLAASSTPRRIIEAFCKAPFCQRVLAAGDTKASILTRETVQVDLRVVKPESFGAALQYFTGSKEHNVRLRELAGKQGFKINEYGIFQLKNNRKVGGREEADIYKALGLSWIPPELREDGGELDAAKSGSLPDLVEAKDLCGDFHIHSNWSDGVASLEAVAKAGQAKGYAYIALNDHSQSLKVANGMSIARIRSQMKEVAALNAKFKSFRMLMGSEVDILNDGSLDYPDEVLAELDFVIGSIHSGFTQNESTLTRRMTTAMRNPYLTLIAHPTGRLMGQREPYAINLDEVFKAAKQTKTAMEINAYPRRLDLCDTAARKAKEMGVMLAISTDTHSLDNFDNMTFGLGVARRAWLEPKNLLNCLNLAALIRWIAEQRTFKKKL